MNKPVGGRGIKAPYETTVMRVPLPLASDIRRLIDDFTSFLVANGIQDPKSVLDSSKTVGTTQLSKHEAIMEAKKILKAKKSAKQSIEKLLQVLYDDEIDLNKYD